MKITIGMACYNDFSGVYFSVQALRMFQDMKDCEVLIIDNYGSDRLRDFWEYWGKEKTGKKNEQGEEEEKRVVRYIKFTDVVGTTVPRQLVFERAYGEFVLCIDSHVMLFPGAIKKLKEWLDEGVDTDALIHGPMSYDSLDVFSTHMNPVWRSDMWGTWSDTVRAEEIPGKPFEIPAHGMGLFGSRKDTWLNFNDKFTGFGGEECYIHEKYRQTGRKILCLPFLKWVHRFSDKGDIKYPLDVKDRIRNYIIGFQELGLDLTPVKEHFGSRLFDLVYEKVRNES